MKESDRVIVHVTVIARSELDDDDAHIGQHEQSTPTAFLINETDYNVESFDNTHLDDALDRHGAAVSKKSKELNNFEEIFTSRLSAEMFFQCVRLFFVDMSCSHSLFQFDMLT